MHDRADRPSAAELRSMAMRQQQQIDTQHQMLAAKEQRLRFLKSQETLNVVSVAEAERLRRLRERVEAQESKLRRLRALRGQVDLQKTYNVTLGNDLDSIRALFSEKEKELTLAVAKVEALTRQLEELRRDRRGVGTNGISYNLNPNSLNNNGSPAGKELEKLRLELVYRNQLSMQQNARLNMQREVLQQRQIELHSVDKRIVELQSRINKKRILNVQNYKLNAANNNNNPGSGQNHSKTIPSNSNHALHARSSSTHIIPSHSRTLSRGNVVAVEPFNHVPVKSSSVGTGSNHSSSPSPLVNANEKMSQPITSSSDFMQHQQQQQPMQNYQWDHDKLGVMMGGDEAMLLAPESDEKKLAVRQQQQQQYRTRYVENVGIVNGPESAMEDDAATGKGNYSEPQHNMIANDFEMKNASNATSKYDNEKGTFEYFNHNNVEGDLDSATGTANEKGQSRDKSIGAAKTFNNNPEKHQQSNSNQPKANYNFLQNIPLGNLVVPPRKPINSVAPTLAMKHVPSTTGTTNSTSETTSAKITSVTRKVPPGIDSGGAPMNEAQQTSIPASPNNNSRPALPPKPSKPSGIGNAGGTAPFAGLASTGDENSNDTLAGPLASSENDSSSGASYDIPDLSLAANNSKQSTANDKLPIKAKPLTIRKHPFLEQPKLKNFTNSLNPNSGTVTTTGLNKMPNPSAMQQQQQQQMTNKRKEAAAAAAAGTGNGGIDSTQYSNYEKDAMHDKKSTPDPGEMINSGRDHPIERLKKLKGGSASGNDGIGNNADSEVTRRKRNFILMAPDSQGNSGNMGIMNGAAGVLSEGSKHKLSRRVSFDPLALLLDASLEGELELVEKTAMQVTNPSAANDEGITALHNAICAGHFEIVKFLVNFGCDVNAQDSDGWTPLHCAASCNNLPMVKFLVESGACLFAATLSDHETPAEKCEEDEEGFDGCSEYLYSIQEKLGILNNGEVHAVFAYESQQPDELSFFVNDKLTIIRKGDEAEREWWWARNTLGKEGYVPRNLLG
uniref:SH3 domain-containing protein n=1 Tax=Anopheles stephensi TaxID=30069 RepID=A0A182YN27_ANOST